MRLFRNTADEFLKIQVEGEAETIQVTLGHPFYVHRNKSNLSADADEEGDWVLSKSLRVGDLLKSRTGAWKPILSIEKVAETKATYNFEVAKNHDYFVGENGWLVHNQSTTTVGRWMSQGEYNATQKTGMVQESWSGTTHVANPADVTAFMRQAKPGSIYAQFDVPTNSLVQTGSNWAKILGPNTSQGRLSALKGLPVPQMPPATNISAPLASRTRFF